MLPKVRVWSLGLHLGVVPALGQSASLCRALEVPLWAWGKSALRHLECLSKEVISEPRPDEHKVADPSMAGGGRCSVTQAGGILTCGELAAAGDRRGQLVKWGGRCVRYG